MSIEIEVLKLHSPGPVRVGEARLKGSVCQFAHPVVQIENVVHVLAGYCGKQERADGCNLSHGGLGAVMVGARHVGNEKVGSAIAIEIRDIGTHREPRGMGSGLPYDVGESVVAIVAVETVRILEVISNVDIGEAVVVEIPPGDRVSPVPPRDACGPADIDEANLTSGIRSVVTKQEILPPGIDVNLLPASPGHDIVILFEAILDFPFVVHQFDRVVPGSPPGSLEVPSEQKAVKIPVEVVITECGHQAGIGDCQPIGFSALRKFSFAIIDP